MQKEQSTKNNVYMQRILKDKVLTRLEIIRRYHAGEKPLTLQRSFLSLPEIYTI
jgi:hypothetical protein